AGQARMKCRRGRGRRCALPLSRHGPAVPGPGSGCCCCHPTSIATTPGKRQRSPREPGPATAAETRCAAAAGPKSWGMAWTITEDVAEYLAAAGEFLRPRTAEHTVLIIAAQAG